MERYRESIFGGSSLGGSYNAYSSSGDNTYQALYGYAAQGATVRGTAIQFGGQIGHGPQGGNLDNSSPSADGLTYF